MRTLMLAIALCIPSAVSDAPAPAVGDGYWHSSGNKIVDAAGNQVHFSGVNFGGFESENYALHGTWGGIGRNWKDYLDQMKTLGFNLIRLPFSGDLFAPGRMPLNIDYGANPDLSGKTSLQFLDMFVDECGKRGIRIILDYHRIQAGGTPENGLWFLPGSSAYTEAFWINNWKALVGRYVGNSTVVGCDLFNEVHDGGTHPGPFWDADGANEPYNWRTAAIRCGNAILSVNPDLLICVQGMYGFGSATSWWGANQQGIVAHPISMSVANRIVYEVHDYGPNVWNQPWHNDPNFPNNLPGFWDGQWGFVHNNNIGPVWIGEWGTKYDIAKEVQWATTLRDYIASKGLSWTWWTWGPNSGDTGGVLQDDWTHPQTAKLSLMGPVMYPGFAASGGGAPPPPPPPPPPPGTPFGGVARAVPGTVEAEDFDDGGEGVGYHDSDALNSGGQYRSTGVDVEACSDAGAGYDVGWLSPGEWLQYTVNVAAAGTYTVSFRVASALSGGTMHLSSGAANLTGTVTAPGTGGWQTWQTVTATGITLAAGTQALRLVFDSGSFNFNSMSFASTSPAPPPPPPGGGGPASSKSKGGGGGGACGLTGLETVGLLGLLALRRRRAAIRS